MTVKNSLEASLAKFLEIAAELKEVSRTLGNVADLQLSSQRKLEQIRGNARMAQEAAENTARLLSTLPEARSSASAHALHPTISDAPPNDYRH